jgi:hypothetical protein
MTYKLMVKRHTTTNLKYLCITKRENYLEYSGSGVYWKKHLKTHGSEYSTELLYESSNYEVFIAKCLEYSALYNIVESDEWANAIPESGYGNSESGRCNFELYWEYVDDTTKANIISRRNQSIKSNHWATKSHKDKVCGKIAKGQKSHWSSLNAQQKEKQLVHMRAGFAEMIDAHDERYESWSNKLSEKQKLRNMKPRPQEHCDNIRNARLNMSTEAKEARAEKIRESYSDGKHDQLFERYSIERRGANNPSAKRVSIDGVEYGALSEAVIALKTSYSTLSKRLNSTSEKWKNWVRL